MSTAPMIAADSGEDARRSTLDARRSTLDARRSTLDGLARSLVPISLSLLLLTAAFLKGYELYAVPLPEASVWSSRAFRIGVIEAEGFLALWLLSGLGARLARSAALAAFHVFFTVSLSQAVAGKESCGCFGRVPVDPRGTAALDFIAILALWLWRPDVRPGSAMGPRSPRLAGMLLLFLLVGIPGGMVLAARWPDIEADGSVVVLRSGWTAAARCCPTPTSAMTCPAGGGWWSCTDTTARTAGTSFPCTKPRPALRWPTLPHRGSPFSPCRPTAPRFGSSPPASPVSRAG
jgi:hypothetical protein